MADRAALAAPSCMAASRWRWADWGPVSLASASCGEGGDQEHRSNEHCDELCAPHSGMQKAPA